MEKNIEIKIKRTFDGFPGVDHLWVDESEVYFDERENCQRVIRSEFFAKPKSKPSNHAE